MSEKQINEIISRGIDFVMQHLYEEITVEDVAKHCHFSKYYYCRVFKEQTGESVYSFIKRMRLEQSAVRLKTEKNKSITDTGEHIGYSASNYSTVFRQRYQLSPAEFRKKLNRISMTHPFFTYQTESLKTFEEYNQKISIQELPDFYVIYERRIGNYIHLKEDWKLFLERYQDYYTEESLLIERSYNDPTVTELENCLYDIGMTVEPDCPAENVAMIPGGKYAVYRFEGKVSEIFFAFQGLFAVWLAGSKYEMSEKFGLDIYRSVDEKNMQMVIDLCIPIK